MRFVSVGATLVAVMVVAWAGDIPGRAAARLFPGNTWLQPHNMPPSIPDLSQVYPTSHAEIVMLGDSLMDAAEWSELLPELDIVNRGIPGDTVVGMLARIGTVTSLRPATVLVMGGINDLSLNRPPSAVLDDYGRLVSALQTSGARVIIQSTLHVGHDRVWPGVQRFRNYRRNSSIVELNIGLQRLADEKGATFLDLNAVLAPGGEMPESLTFDGVHLRPPAYKLWSDAVRRTVGASAVLAIKTPPV
jgi:lysophospholipase L1-like esterase